MEANELKKRLATARATGRGSYPPALREVVVAYAAKRRAQRVSRDRVAAELGMSVATLGYWCARPRHTGSLAAVTVISEPALTQELVLECGPLRIRGLDVGSVAELLKRLT